MPRSFADSKGRHWILDLNVTLIDQVKAQTEQNLYELVDRTYVEKLEKEPRLLVQILWCLIEDQVPTQEPVCESPEDFGRALGGDSLEDATIALLRAFADFCPRARRRALLKAIEKTGEAQAKAADGLIEVMDGEEIDAIVAKDLERARAELREMT